jgi:hypothetical protein
MSQVKTKSAKLKTLMTYRAFVDGFNDVRAGAPFNYDYSTDVDKQWQYERGRMLALYWKGDNVKNGARIRWDALEAMNKAVWERVVI